MYIYIYIYTINFLIIYKQHANNIDNIIFVTIFIILKNITIVKDKIIKTVIIVINVKTAK